MIKSEELLNPDSCLNKAEDDEPVFVLRANDPLAPNIVHCWALEYWHDKANPRPNEAQIAKFNEALELSAKMREWRANRGLSAKRGLRT